MSYHLEVLLLAMHAQNRFLGAEFRDLNEYGDQVIATYDTHIDGALNGRQTNEVERSVIAALCTMVTGVDARDRAKRAVAIFTDYYGH